MKEHILLGKVITKVYLAEDRQAIKFDIKDGEPIIAKVDGDCCSRTWIENVEGIEQIIGSPVFSAEDIGMPESQDDEYGTIQFYGFKIQTDKGTCVIDYRNESNGYYGGDMRWPREDDEYNDYYGGVHGQNVSEENWREIDGKSI